MKKDIKDALTVIFSDAEVLDIDLSSWDKSISVIVEADHYESYYTEDGFFAPLVHLKFLEVTDVHIEFIHHIKNDILDTDTHFVWTSDRSNIGIIGKQYFVEFSNGSLSPKFLVKFKNVEIQIIDKKYFESINKNWNKQGAGLARPSIFKLYDIITNKKNK